jgi:hypothetical protein
MTDTTRAVSGVVSVTASQFIEAVDDATGSVIHVPFDNCDGRSAPGIGVPVSMFMRGWSFSRRPERIWSLEEPVVVKVPSFEVELTGFRRGRLRHLKFLVHEIGLDRNAFRAKPLPSPRARRALPVAVVQSAVATSGCPGETGGQSACKPGRGEPSCSSQAYWKLEPTIGRAAREYEQRVLDVMTSKNVVGCIAVASADGDSASQANARFGTGRKVLSMLLAQPEQDLFLEAATVPIDQERFALLSAWFVETGAVEKLLRRAADAESIERICGMHVARAATNQLGLIQRRKLLEKRAFLIGEERP